MKYSDFLKANGISHEEVWKLLATRCEEQKEMDTLVSWWKTGMEKTPSSPKYARYEKELQTLIEKGSQDDSALFSATLGSWRAMEEAKEDFPSLEMHYVMEANY